MIMADLDKRFVEAHSGSNPSEEEAAAIAMALHRYMNDTVHDTESYIITIKRKRR